MIKRIYLIRHGMIDTGNVKRYIGITDLPLNQPGIYQAVYLKRYFKEIPINRIFTSPLTRCVQTAKIISDGKKQPYEIVKEFEEINLGLWENKPIHEIRTNFKKAYEERGNHLLTYKPPQGESFQQLEDRVLPAFKRIVKDYTENVLIVGHAGVNRTILREIERISIQDFFQIQQPYGCVYELNIDAKLKWQVKRLF